MTVDLPVSQILSNSVSNLLYQLVLLLAVGAALAMAWGEWRRARSDRTWRLFLATLGLTLVRVCTLGAALLVQVRWASPELLIPPLERFADTASIALLGWAFTPSAKRGARAWDLAFGLNLILAVFVCVGFSVVWGQAWIDGLALAYNVYWQATVWSAWQIGLAALAIFAVVRERGEGWNAVLLALLVLPLGQVLQMAYPLAGVVPHLPLWERLANLVAYPLVTAAVYQRIVSGLRVRSRQLQDISQASLDQLKSLLYLFDASQRMSSSLDLSTVLDSAVEGVARALDADQCAIAFPSESDRGQMRLVAVYSPAQKGAGEAATFPLEYQLAIQQAMRRKSHVLVEELDNVQLKTLFSLLGSSQTGPLLVQPLLAAGKTLGVIIVGNGRSGRPFGPNEAKLCQAMAEHVVSAIQNTRRYQMAQDKIAELTMAQLEARRVSQQAMTQAQEASDQLAAAHAEIESLGQARDALEIKLVSRQADADPLPKRVALPEREPSRQQAPELQLDQTRVPGTVVGILVTDTERLIRAANPAAMTLLGRSWEELEGLPLHSLSSEGRWQQAIAEAAHGRPVRLRAQIEANTLLCDLARLADGGENQGQVQRYIAILQPLSPEVEAKRTQLGTIAAMIEELRAPMTTIIGYADLLLSEATGGVSDVQRKFLLRVKAGAERVVQMIKDLSSEVSGAEQPSPPQRQAVPIDTLVEDAVATARTQLEDRILTLDLQVSDGLPAVKADPGHLRRVLSCLVSNACLASPVGGRIEVGATLSEGAPPGQGRRDQQNNGFVTISIKDSGGGLSDETLDQVFERTRPSQTPSGLGESGAGLAQAKMLVEAQGGHLWVESEDGVGTTFSFVLPIDKQK